MKLSTGISLTICGFEIMFIGGVILAWNPMLYMFIEDGIYSDKCHHDNVTKGNDTTSDEDCSERDSLFNVCFILGFALYGLSSFPFGIFFDRYGLRTSRMVTSIVSLIGMLSWGFADKENPWMVFVGSIVLGLAASFICTTNMHAAQLAGKRAGILISVFVALYDISGLWLSLVLVLHQVGFHRKWSLLVLSSLLIPGMWNTFCLLPKFKIGMNKTGNVADKPNEKDDASDYPDKKHTTDTSSLCRSVWYYIFSPVYLLHLFWFCLMALSINTFYGTMVPWITDIYPNDTHKVSTMVEMFGYLSLISVMLSPLFGQLMDHFRNKYSVEDSTNLWLKAKALQYPSLIATAGEIAFNVAHLGRMEWTIYALFVLNFMVASSVYAVAVRFIPVVFPLEHYGKLLGLEMCLSSLINFVQIPLLKWAQNTSYFQMRLFLLALTLLGLLHPLCIMYKSRRQKSFSPTTTDTVNMKEKNSYVSRNIQKY